MAKNPQKNQEGGTAEINCHQAANIVIRILKKREVIENPCPPFSSPDDDLTVHIGHRQVTVSANWLMVVSPVVKRMLSVEMKEKQQRTLNLDGHDITMEQFKQFLETVNDHLQHGRTLPNPTNVLVLLKLADYFQMDWLKERCDAHLVNCVEIPLIERFLLIEPYRLSNLKNFFMRSLNIVNLREFLKKNREQQLLSDASIDKEFWFELAIRQQ
uniref:BTB domain-containing protein n=1 Tax=Globodera pallida TaxID=36090 RepID=A0A183C5J5_GLOPA